MGLTILVKSNPGVAKGIALRGARLSNPLRTLKSASKIGGTSVRRYLYIANPPHAVGCTVVLGVGQFALPGSYPCAPPAINILPSAMVGGMNFTAPGLPGMVA